MSDEKKDLSIKNMVKVEDETIKQDESVNQTTELSNNEVINPLVKVKKQEQWKRSVLNDIRSFMKMYEPFRISFEKRADNLIKSQNPNEHKTGQYFYMILGYVQLLEEKRVTMEQIEKELNAAIYT